MARKKKAAAKRAAPVSILKDVTKLDREAESAVNRLKRAVESGAAKSGRRLGTARRRKRALGRKRTALGKRIGRLRAAVKKRNVGANRRALEAAENERKEVLADLVATDREILLMREENAALKLMLGENQVVGAATQKARRAWGRRVAKKARQRRR